MIKSYDLAVIGSGAAGQKAAIQAAKLGKSVCVVERRKVLGGVTVNTGTIPSKALREAIILLTGEGKHSLMGDNFRAKRKITIADLMHVAETVIRHEWVKIQDQFDRNDIDLHWGQGQFVDAHTLQVVDEDETVGTIRADKFFIAVGTDPWRPEHIPFNTETVMCSDEVLQMQKVPKSMLIVGAGVIGCEYACMLAALGVAVTLVERGPRILSFLDQEIGEAFQYSMRENGITLRLNEKVESVEEITATDGKTKLVQATLASGKKMWAEKLLFAAGRQGVCDDLRLANVGIEYDDRHRLKVNENYQTEVPHIYAGGDVIGFPSLASTSMMQGRNAVCHAFGEDAHALPELFPYGIYAIPEISTVGRTEEQLTHDGIPYEAGVGHYNEVARGQLLGDNTGKLKLLIHQETHKILGVHIIGTGATELVHLGQMAMAFDAPVEFFVNNVFNYPTLAEAYKVAALNGLNKLKYYS